MRQRRWLELIKDYDVTISYHPGKEFDKLEIEIRIPHESAGTIYAMTFQPGLLEKIRRCQDEVMSQDDDLKGEEITTQKDNEGILRFASRIWIPNVAELKEEIMRDAHNSKYSIHPGSTKMYRDLKENFWWPNMKKEIAEWVSKCYTCQRVKAEHQRLSGLLQPLNIPEWKWEHLAMDFVVGLPRTKANHDAIWVILDRLTKSAHFLPINERFSLDKLVHLYLKEIVMRHGVPVSIVSDRDPRFNSRFWRQFQECLGTKLNMSTAYHPQTDGQSERTIQTIEDMLRLCAIDFEGSWDEHLPLLEFSYNNSYHASIGMPPYEALYGRKCRSPVHWDEVGERKILGPELIRQTKEKIELIRKRIEAAQNRQRKYADQARKDMEYQEGEHVLLKISPWKGLTRFGNKGKLKPRYVGPFEILKKIGKVAYELGLPPHMQHIHNVFHVSMLKKYNPDTRHVIEYEPVELQADLSYVEQPIRILDRQEKVLRNKSSNRESFGTGFTRFGVCFELVGKTAMPPLFFVSGDDVDDWRRRKEGEGVCVVVLQKRRRNELELSVLVAFGLPESARRRRVLGSRPVVLPDPFGLGTTQFATRTRIVKKRVKQWDPLIPRVFLPIPEESFELPDQHIKAATNNIDAMNKIGEGGFGSVYKGTLSDGKVISVKKLSSQSRQGNHEFLNEVAMISCVQYPNLVKLYGCYIEEDQLLRIYDFMKNNSPANALFNLL
ncbi:hypothetical protein AgCh_022794 [Apium graveolens]